MPELTFRYYTVAVHDLDAAIADHEARFGMRQIGERTHNSTGNFDGQAMGYGDKVMLRLITPSAPDTPIAKLMLERVNAFNPHGEGMYLMAYDCDDLEGFCAQVIANGGRVNRAPNSTSAWVHPTASNFVLMEIIQAK